MKYKSHDECQKRVTYSLDPMTVEEVTEMAKVTDLTRSKYVERSIFLAMAVRVEIGRMHEDGESAEEAWQEIYECYCDRFHCAGFDYETQTYPGLEKIYQEYRDLSQEFNRKIKHDDHGNPIE